MSENVLEWKNLFYEKINSDKNLDVMFARTVDGLSGKAVSGQLTAVMGSSGAGKTNLFELLVGKIAVSSKTSGEVLFNGKERKLEEWVKKISYLEQDDVFFPELTICESMFYSLQLLYPNVKKDVIDSMIEKALKRAEIYNKKDALIKSLSGGERKRAMIALKLIGEPEVLILDEPTTGLDSHNALCIVNNLRKEAQEQNIIVIMTVHQPGEALFNLFDRLIYITKKGVLYEGPVEEVEEFLNSYGIKKMDKISTAEFLFELFSQNPYPYEIKDLQPRAEEIVRKNREKTEDARRKLDLKVVNNSYVNLDEIKFSHMCMLMGRKVYLITRTPYIWLWFVYFFSVMGLGIFINRFRYKTDIVPRFNLKDNPAFFSEMSFLESAAAVFRNANLLGKNSLIWVLFFSFKFPYDSDVCKQEIFSGRYSVSTYFASMISFELISYFFCSLFFMIPEMYLFSNIKCVINIFIISLAYILAYYFALLPIFSYFSGNYKVYFSVYGVYLISIANAVGLKTFCEAIDSSCKGLRYVFCLYNFLPLFLFICLLEFTFSKLFESFKQNGRTLLFDDGNQFVPSETLLESFKILGYGFNPIFVSIWFVILIVFFIYASFIFIKWKVSSNIRLKLN